MKLHNTRELQVITLVEVDLQYVIMIYLNYNDRELIEKDNSFQS